MVDKRSGISKKKAPNEIPDPTDPDQYGKPKYAPDGTEPEGGRVGRDQSTSDYLHSTKDKHRDMTNMGVMAGAKSKNNPTGLSNREISELEEIKKRAGIG